MSTSFRVPLWGLLGEASQGRTICTFSRFLGHLGLPPLPGALAWDSLAHSSSRSQAVASGAVPPSCTPTFAWCLGHLGLAQRVPQAHDPGDAKTSPRPTSRLRKGKEDSLNATPLCLYKLTCNS